ncbi:MAG: MFS transporter [Clostridia bacterium]|nr:MFS transporter [Clostridia bacterium]
MNGSNDVYKTSRFLYIIEAALEYFIALGVGGVYLAKLTTAVGISDSLTGILTSFVSLGCGFQLIAIFIAHKKPVKRWVTVGHIVSQFLFVALYFVPLFEGVDTGIKIVLFFILMLGAQIIHNAINSPKTGWYMDLIDYDKRGSFTATKEIVSLISGIVFSYFMGYMIDSFEMAGNMQGAFITGGITLFVIAVLHTLTLIFSKEKPAPEMQQKINVKVVFSGLIKDKSLYKVMVIAILWAVANYATTSFMGTYQTKELGFTTTFASVVVIVSSIARALVSRPMGKFADKKSFASALVICFSIEFVGFAVASCTTPENGKILYPIFLCLHAIGMSVINSATINLIYDYVAPERRTVAYAFQQTVAGVAGFLIVTVLSPLVTLVQNNGNNIFGMTVYAQQLCALFSALVCAVAVVYIIFVLKKMKRASAEEVGEEKSE